MYLFLSVAIATNPGSTDLVCPTGFKVTESRFGDFGIRKTCTGKKNSAKNLPEKVIRDGWLWLEKGSLQGGDGKFSKIWSERGNLISEMEESLANPKCGRNTPFPQQEILVGYVKGQSFYALVSTQKKALIAYHRLKNEGVQELFGIGATKIKIEWLPVQEDEIVSQCVYSGTLKSKIPDFSALSNNPGILREPTEREKNRFAKEYSKCIPHGDSETPGQMPCEKNELKAVSDANNDGVLEFWYRAPFRWDIGFGMVEFDQKMDKFYYFEEKCDFCGD